MTHNHATRAIAQLTIDAIVRWIRGNDDFRHLFPERETFQERNFQIWPNVLKYLVDNKELVRLKKGLGASLKQLEVHDAIQWITPQNVFEIPKDVQNDFHGFEAVPEPLIEAIQTYLSFERLKVRETNDKALAEKEKGSHRPLNTNEFPSDPSKHVIQRKITTSERLALIYGGETEDALDCPAEALKWTMPVCDGHDWLRLTTSKTKKQNSLIVVASLIDKVPNLAGLARTCEVFQTRLLVVADRSVTKSQSFTSISVTAEEWIEIEEVKPAALSPWLLGKKSEGYALIGLEQTSESTSLQDLEFPLRSVLILGKEKEGIPADLLSSIDSTIEIPQFGRIRSLNVHVSGALAIYEYTRQHCIS